MASSQTIEEQITKAESETSDSLKIVALSKVAFKLVKTDSKKAFDIAHRAFAIAGKNLNLQGVSYMAQASLYSELTQYNKALELINSALKIYQSQNNFKRLAFSYDKAAFAYKKLGKPDRAAEVYRQCIEVAKKVPGWETTRKAYKDLGFVLTNNGQNPKAIATLQEQLTYATSLQPLNHAYLAAANIDIAYNYITAGEYATALPYALASHEHAQVTKDNFQMLDAYNTTGVCYKNIHKEKESIVWFDKAISILEQPGQNKFFLASVLMNVGGTLYDIGDFKKGLEYKERSLKICQETSNEECIMNNYISLGLDLVEKEKQYDKGIDYLKKAEDMLSGRDLYKSRYVYEGLYKAYSAKADYEKAFSYMSKFMTFRDSIMSSEKLKQTNELEAKYESSKKQQQIELLGRNKRIQELQLLQNHADLDKQKAENKAKQNSILLLEKDKDLNEASLKKKEAEAEKQQAQLKLMDEQKKMTESENRNQRVIIYSFIGGLILLVVLLFNIFRNYQQKKKANLEITQQKAELQIQKNIVDEKNKEIIDSIAYAKRLQEAILPPIKLVKSTLPDSFVLYQPKDIVAGDFYWMHTTESHSLEVKGSERTTNNPELILIAAADCTGHGVPGAMVSVVCSNALNRAVKEFDIKDPGKILNKVRELVIETFDKSESEVKDGMDISLCAIDLKTCEVKWSGANNPIWILKKNSDDMMEIKADKQPIGRYIDPKPFTTNTIQLQKEDIIYLFTDGYADQFGGPKGKKFKYSSLSKLMKSISHLNMNEQRNKLEETFKDWKGNLDQVDDVCVIGIKMA
jgi:serine phosphatase RsbU (regulator of sigma subunit)